MPSAQPEKGSSSGDGANALETQLTRNRYNRIASIYDRLDYFSEWRFKPWRQALWRKVKGPQVLEIGVGTGKNMPYYPEGVQMTSIDLSPRMLALAKKRAQQENKPVDLMEADTQALPFAEATFDTVVATFVFCSVPDPIQGLREIRRVLKPGGQLLLLEHILAERPWLKWLMNVINPVMVRLTGANINRKTPDNVEKAGFQDIQVQRLLADIVVEIEATQTETNPSEQSTVPLSEVIPSETSRRLI